MPNQDWVSGFFPPTTCCAVALLLLLPELLLSLNMFCSAKSCAKLMLETDTPLVCGLASFFLLKGCLGMFEMTLLFHPYHQKSLGATKQLVARP